MKYGVERQAQGISKVGIQSQRHDEMERPPGSGHRQYHQLRKEESRVKCACRQKAAVEKVPEEQRADLGRLGQTV